MIYYLTYNEPFSGIFNSQVLDVVKHLRTEHKQDIRLISFVPIGFKLDFYKKTKSQLKFVEPSCIVIPTVPIQYGWKFNWILLAIILLFHKRGSIFSREVQASYLAIKCRNVKLTNKVCYDARGANYAQMLEYNIYSNNIKGQIFDLEKFVVMRSDYRLAVSQSLVNYWFKTYDYSSNQHVVIPTTISSDMIDKKSNLVLINQLKNEYNFKADDIVLVFSGSNYEWQSFDLIFKYCELQISANSNVKIVFLSKKNEEINAFMAKFPNRIYCCWLKIDEVFSFLELCDYGILLRESNDTNNVASPTKFAEYLAAGLPVIISDNLDFARIVKTEDCGIIINNETLTQHVFIKTKDEYRNRLKAISAKHFLKSSPNNKLGYKAIVYSLNN